MCPLTEAFFFSPAFGFFSGFSYIFLILFLGLKREEKKRKRKDGWTTVHFPAKAKKRKRNPPAKFYNPRRIRFLLLKCDFNTRIANK